MSGWPKHNPQGEKYMGDSNMTSQPADQQGDAPTTEWMVFCAGCRKQWSVPYQHPGKSICAGCESILEAHFAAPSGHGARGETPLEPGFVKALRQTGIGVNWCHDILGYIDALKNALEQSNGAHAITSQLWNDAERRLREADAAREPERAERAESRGIPEGMAESLAGFDNWWALYWGYDGRDEDVSDTAEAAWNASAALRAPHGGGASASSAPLPGTVSRRPEVE